MEPRAQDIVQVSQEPNSRSLREDLRAQAGGDGHQLLRPSFWYDFYEILCNACSYVLKINEYFSEPK